VTLRHSEAPPNTSDTGWWACFQHRTSAGIVRQGGGAPAVYCARSLPTRSRVVGPQHCIGVRALADDGSDPARGQGGGCRECQVAPAAAATTVILLATPTTDTGGKRWLRWFVRVSIHQRRPARSRRGWASSSW